jgi:hypothetical protein
MSGETVNLKKVWAIIVPKCPSCEQKVRREKYALIFFSKIRRISTVKNQCPMICFPELPRSTA